MKTPWTCIPALFLLLAAPGCKKVETDAPAPREESDRGGLTLPPEPDARDQYALARTIEELEALDPFDAAPLYQQTRTDWLGKRYTWSVYLIPELCPNERRCYVLPFDRRGQDRELVHGWMPRLDLDEESFTELRSRCGDEPRCRVTFQGTLDQFVLSTERPTSLAFTDVNLEG